MLHVDLHCHTAASRDARTTPRELVERAAEAGLDRVAVTDHGEIEGALRARSLDPGRIIVGEEIRCGCRTEIIGLFLDERIPPGLSLAETVERIRDQGGVVYLPHPYAYAWRPSRHARRGLARADAVEVVNARAFLPAWNRRAGRVAERMGLPACGASDAHFPEELGRAFTRMPSFRDAASFRDALAETRPVHVATTGPVAHVASAARKAARLATELLPSMEFPGATPVPQREGSARG